MKNEVKKMPICKHEEHHPHAIALSLGKMPEKNKIFSLSDFFKILGDSTRIRILFALDGAPLCVCDLAELLGMTKSAVSHQLKILRQSALVVYRKAGKNVYYSLADDHVVSIIETALAHIEE